MNIEFAHLMLDILSMDVQFNCNQYHIVYRSMDAFLNDDNHYRIIHYHSTYVQNIGYLDINI